MRRRSWIPLVTGVLLIALAALVMTLSDGGRPARAAASVEFPRHLRPAERDRIEARRTLPPARIALAPDAPAGQRTQPERRDAFLVALPTDATKPLVILEANALRHSRLGELFVECVLRTSRDDPFEKARRELGLDPLKDVDRVAFAPGGVVISGFFERARFEQLEGGARAVPYGESGRLYAPASPAGAGAADDGPYVGAWGDRLVVIGERAFVQATIDRLEGRAPDAPPVLPARLTYGEVYGVLPGDGLRALLRGEQSELGRRLGEIASRIELHVDAMRDVAVVARVSGQDAAGLEDLGKAMGAALAVGRIQARARGDEKLMDLLEYAKVERHDSGFSLELALPVDVLERWFAGCGHAL